MSNSLPEGVIRIHLDTTRRFSARLAAQIIDTMAASIEGNPSFQPGAMTSLVASGEGTWWAHLAILAGGVGTCVLAIQGLAEEIRQGRTPFSRAVPAALEQGDGRHVTLCADDIEIRINVTEILAYPPPVSEDRIEWVRGRPSISLDYPNKSSPTETSDAHGEFNSLAEVFDLIQKTGDLEQEDLQPRSATTRQMWRESWENYGTINVKLEDANEQSYLVIGTFRAGFPLATIEVKDGTVLLQGLGRGLPVTDGDQVTVIGKHEATFLPINAILVEPYRIMKYAEKP